MKRFVRMGIDVGGTHTKAVAIDNATHEIIGKVFSENDARPSEGWLPESYNLFKIVCKKI